MFYIMRFIFLAMLCQVIALVDDKVPIITVNGRLETVNNHYCIVNVNGLKIEGKGKFDGLHYGFIEYNCDNITGVLVSKAECNSCGLYCASNEIILECRQRGTLFLFGFIIGLIPTIVLVIVLRKILYSIGHKIIDNVVYWYDNKRDEMELKKANKISKRIDGNIRVKASYKRPITINPKKLNKLDAKRTTNSDYVTIIAEDPIEIVESPTSMSEKPPIAPKPLVKPKPINIPNKHENSKKVKTPYGAANVLLASLAISGSLCSLPTSHACDNTLYVYSQGKVCDDQRCVEGGIYQLSLQSGSTVCFRDSNGDTMSMRVSDSYYRDRYMLQYYTSDYTLNVNTYSRCKVVNGECWNSSCNKTSKNPHLKYSLDLPYPIGYGCGVDSLGCDTWCWHETSCTWYVWHLKPKGEKYPVYVKIGRIWEVEITMEYGNEIRKHTMNTNNPKVNLDGIGYKLPIYIAGFSAEDIVSDNGLVIVSKSAYLTKVATKNMPESDIIGDYQISTHEDEFAFNNEIVDCSPSSCKANCVVREPKIKRFMSSLDRTPNLPFRYINNEHIAETTVYTTGSINMMVGNVKFDNLYVTNAKCDIDVITTFSCISCTQKPYAVLQAYNIKSPGLVPFTSNCTFETNYLSCNPEPMKLNQITTNKLCMVSLELLNTTIMINYNFTYYGSLTPSKFIMGRETFQDTIMSIGTSTEFWTSLTSTFAIGTAGVFITSVIFRVLKIVMLAKSSKEIINTDK